MQSTPPSPTCGNQFGNGTRPGPAAGSSRPGPGSLHQVPVLRGSIPAVQQLLLPPPQLLLLPPPQLLLLLPPPQLLLLDPESLLPDQLPLLLPLDQPPSAELQLVEPELYLR
ncbi:hypothetical protein ACFWPK_16135 [Nocardia sp. NPDC058519]|uniref:hypothetical protein n=1 Tax=Nocardia sp. NPDC058519 TaxID=3346535 RepID=UPI0036478EA9